MFCIGAPLHVEFWRQPWCRYGIRWWITVRVKIITGSLVSLEDSFPPNDRYRYRLELRMNSHVFLTVSSKPCLETSPHSILRAPFAGHCLGALWRGKPCPTELSERVNRVLWTLSGDTRLPILQTPSAGHCLDTHGIHLITITVTVLASAVTPSFPLIPNYHLENHFN